MSAAPALLEAAAPLDLEAFDAAAFRALFAATDEQMADLEAFRVLLVDWNGRMNLVGPSALAEFWPRHVLDSAQLLLVAPKAKAWADLGAGAGFPGLVLAILLKAQPGAHVHLVESMAKRCRFLEAVVQALGLPASVHHARAEDLSLKVHVVTARAVAPLGRLLEYARPHLKKNVIGLFLKGQDVDAELVEATRYWKFEASLLPSLSSSGGRIVQLKGLSRA
jgi:16S rRNA (guanine527-N7)-methyltransferase